MSKKVLHALYFADDKDIFDLLTSARQRLTPQKLVDFARGRGLVLSTTDDRDALIDQLALLPFGWPELQKLIEATDTAERTEKVTHQKFAGAFDLDQMRVATEKVRDARAERGETFSFERTQKALRVRVVYFEIDPTSTRLLQRTQREFCFDFEPRENAVLVRHQDQVRAAEILREIATELSVSSEARIELGGIKSHKLRSEFFLKIVRGISGFSFEDLKSVRASPLPKDNGPEDLEANDNSEPEEAEEDEPDAIVPEKAEFVTLVKELALKGDRIHETPQYKSLDSHGLFVRSVKWIAVEQAPSGARFEFDAGFDNDDATCFTYAVRAKFDRKGDGTFKKTKSTIPSDEKTRLLRLMEEAALTAMEAVVQAATETNEEELDASSTALESSQ